MESVEQRSGCGALRTAGGGHDLVPELDRRDRPELAVQPAGAAPVDVAGDGWNASAWGPPVEPTGETAPSPARLSVQRTTTS